MMQVWIRKARKKATCTHELCKQPEILSGEYYVVCQWYMNTSSGKNWQKQRIFHPQCWIDRAIAEIESKPVPETRGRQKMEISDADREHRMKVMGKRASLIQRLNKAIESNCAYSKIATLTEKIEQCKEEIIPYGGAPKSW